MSWGHILDDFFVLDDLLLTNGMIFQSEETIALIKEIKYLENVGNPFLGVSREGVCTCFIKTLKLNKVI